MKDIFLLDMDDTLLDFRRAERETFFRALEFCGIEGDEGLLARYHTINEGLWKALERGEIERERLKERRFELLFEEAGIKADVPSVARAYYAAMAEICFPFAGARDFLAALKGRGRVYLVTNGGTAVQRRHIELAGFAPFLDGVFISEEIGCNKPSAEYVRYVTSHIEGFSRERAVLIGDSLTSDGKCAEGMGVRFILFAAHGAPSFCGEWAADYGEVLRLIG